MVKYTKIFALAGTAVVFAGMAYGQASCAASAVNNGVIRGESTNDTVGDLLITCTNSTVTPVASGTVNVQVFAPTGVTFTSKILNSTQGYSEAVAFSGAVGVTPTRATYSAAGAVLGTISGSANAITFVGITSPLLNAGNSFSILISNLRVNASGLAVTTGAPPTVSLTAIVSGTPVFQTSLLPQQVAYIQYGLGGAAIFKNLGATTAGTNTNFVICSPPAVSGIAGVNTAGLMFTVKISENFPSAFRLAAQEASPIPIATGGSLPTGNVPPATTATDNSANNNTRLKIVFTNVPTGVSLYTIAASTASVTGAARITYTTSETGAFSAATPVALNGSGNTGFALIPVSSGGATAVFDVSTADLGNLDTFIIPIYIQYASGIPIATTPISATISLAPTGVPNNIPNFNATAGSTVTVTGTTISACSTSLLFPFVTNQLGFDTGIAISNTSTDPFGSKGASPQSGTCSLNFYGAGAPTPASITTPNVPTGTVNAFVLSGVAAGFQGYMIAQCNFQFAHGFAFITNGVGVNGGLSQGYLAGVIPDTNQTNRAAGSGGTGETLGN